MFKRKKQKIDKNERKSFRAYPSLLAIKPKEKYIFHSDYYQVDKSYACILSFFHTEGASDNFGPFWGINKIPSGMDNDVTTIVFEQVRRMTESWVNDHQTKSEGIAQMNENEQNNAGTNTSRHKAVRKAQDFEIIASELQNGASYVQAQYRLLVKAPTLEKLDKALNAIDKLYIDRFGTIVAAPYSGDQRTELSQLFSPNERKLGHGFYFTSTEFAGTYSLVTHGLEDASGEYVGYMLGDVNASAVLLDVNKYTHHIVIASEQYDMSAAYRAHMADLWGSKVSQACMLDNGRVVHLILDGAKMSRLGPLFKNITQRIDMSKGDVNMFEMFGDTKDELSIFPMQMQKLILMAEQAYETTDSDRSIIRAELEKIATKFYIDSRMWYEDAANHRDDLRVVNIPHDEVPTLAKFVMYLQTEVKSLQQSGTNDAEALHVMKLLCAVFKNMLTSNGDLFNTCTTKRIDDAKTGKRVLYDFSGLARRGQGIAMAQFVNIVSFAVGNLGEGDTVIIHGADKISDRVKDYIRLQFDTLYEKGGRVCFLYNNIDKMLKDKEFCEFDKADYTIFGPMSETEIAEYQESLGQNIPPDLARCIVQKIQGLCYIRRGFDNVIFKQELTLGISKGGGKRA